MLLAVIAVTFALSACVLQAAVLRDRTIPERSLVEAMRRLRVGAWLVVAVYVATRSVQGYELPTMLLLTYAAIGGADALSAACRLWPELHEDQHA